jgi:hypothetical protein
VPGPPPDRAGSAARLFRCLIGACSLQIRPLTAGLFCRFFCAEPAFDSKDFLQIFLRRTGLRQQDYFCKFSCKYSDYGKM